LNLSEIGKLQTCFGDHPTELRLDDIIWISFFSQP
jgi:hypothetical protein